MTTRRSFRISSLIAKGYAPNAVLS
jgi:hypothetical protein